jgi:hypothetical protein
MTGRVSLALLVAANLLPLIGVSLWDWDVLALLMLFWCENVIIGLFGIARMVVSASEENTFEGLLLPVFFLVHYGGFMFGHLMVLLFMYSNSLPEAGSIVGPADYHRIVMDNLSWVALIALFVSHGWSFVENFMGNREHERITSRQAMALPYRRMIITHVALIVGGFFLLESGEPLAGLILLVLMKIALDVIFHRREHKRLGVPT